MKEKRHSSGSCLSMRAPTKNGLTSRNRASRAQKSAYSSAWKASFLRRQRVRGERERERARERESERERESAAGGRRPYPRGKEAPCIGWRGGTSSTTEAHLAAGWRAQSSRRVRRDGRRPAACRRCARGTPRRRESAAATPPAAPPRPCTARHPSCATCACGLRAGLKPYESAVVPLLGGHTRLSFRLHADGFCVGQWEG